MVLREHLIYIFVAQDAVFFGTIHLVFGWQKKVGGQIEITEIAKLLSAILPSK